MNKKNYPIKANDSCLDPEPLKDLAVKINEFVEIIERTNIMIDYAESTRLFEINIAIRGEIKNGYDEIDAIVNVSHKNNLPLRMVFLAYNLRTSYETTFQHYIYSLVIKILSDLGLKQGQIYNKIHAITGLCKYDIKDILESFESDIILLPNWIKKEGY